MKNKTVIYTDGGCTGNPGPGGWAAVILSGSKTIEISGGEEHTTNNRMELKAVISALEWCSEQNNITAIELHTDSQYVKNGINLWIHNWRRNGWKTAAKKPVKNRDLWIELYDLNIRFKPEWYWVKGHSGDLNNERCDELVEVERLRYSS